jgi:hypothetical protein
VIAEVGMHEPHNAGNQQDDAENNDEVLHVALRYHNQTDSVDETATDTARYGRKEVPVFE